MYRSLSEKVRLLVTLSGTLALVSADISLARFSDLPTLVLLFPLENNLMFVVSSEWISLMAEIIEQLLIKQCSIESNHVTFTLYAVVIF